MLPPPPRSTLFPYTTLFRSYGPLMKRFGNVPVPNIRRPSDLKRSEEHTSQLQSRGHLVCRLLLEKKNRLLGGASWCVLVVAEILSLLTKFERGRIRSFWRSL